MSVNHFHIILLFVLGCCVCAQRSQLWNIWMNNSVIDRQSDVAVVYQDSLENFQFGSKEIVMLVIGAIDRRVIQSWFDWFKDVDRFVYINLSERVGDTHLLAGSDSLHFIEGLSSDSLVLSSLCAQYGPFDIIVDKGQSSSEVTISTLESLFPCMKGNGFYTIESPVRILTDTVGIVSVDTTTSNYISDVYKLMHHWWTEKANFHHPTYSGSVKSIQMAESIVVLEKGNATKYEGCMRGTERVPYRSSVDVKFGHRNGLVDLTIYVGEYSTSIPHAEINRRLREVCSDFTPFVGIFDNEQQCFLELKELTIKGAYLHYEKFLVDYES